jgi:DNA helicase II / ATP-dependent DNA helicase PcrA
MQAISSPTAFDPPYLTTLNPAQREAVEALDGPVLVLAGAGTGKTRVLTTRLAHLLHTGRAMPAQILAVTFTNRAAQEMRHRVSDLMDGALVEGWWLGTFHALAARMLRAHAEKIGLNSNYTIIDQDDQERLLKQIAEVEKIDTKKWPIRLMADVISRWKDKGLRPDDIGQHDAGDLANGRLPQIYRMYQDRLRTVNACDFGDLLLHMITIFKSPNYADVLATYHQRFRYLLVDEYQDTNAAQYQWLRLLAQGSNNVCCVGDDDQSIYGWRGAEISNILRFEKDFPQAKIVRLEQNYRSTGHILAAASGVIARNQGRLGKTLWSDSGDGDKVNVIGVWDGEAEARTISDKIEELRRMGRKLASCAILVRAGFQMREFEDRLLKIGMPYRVFGGPRFYERAEIRDALAYCRVLVQPQDDLAFERILNTPKRGLGDTTLKLLQTHARERQTTLVHTVMDLITGDTLRPKVRSTLQLLIRDFDRWRSLMHGDNHAEVVGTMLDESGYTAMWQAEKSPDAPGRLDNLKELVTTIADYPTLGEFLEHVALVLDNTANQDADTVTLMTLHSAKGLEFETVFLPGWEDGIFPSQRTMDENGLAGLEEERRLAYVALTRAKRRAFITFAGSRRQYGNWVNNLPSRFISELPEAHVILSGDRGTAYAQPREDHATSWGSTAARLPRSRVIDDHGIQAGLRIRHDTFGGGVVVHVVGNKLDIKFDDGEMRRVMASFVEPVQDYE